MLRGFSFLHRAGCGVFLHAGREKARVRAAIRAVIALSVIIGAAGCGMSFSSLPPGSVAGRARTYDYSPSAIQSGNVLQLWWCGADDNATDRTQISDTIEYESINLATNARYGPVPVLSETQFAWDSNFICNPKVINGSFANPLGDGKTYTYAMYYVGLGATSNNHIGVAFSNDGISWKKYPQPVISSASEESYGVGQPALYNSDHKSGIWMFYEDTNPIEHHVKTVSTDGVHFTPVAWLTTAGLIPDPPDPTWGDMAYDPVTNYWYAVYNLEDRDPATTGNIQERGPYGVALYRIPDASLFTGTTPWELLTIVDTGVTGYESNFLAGFLRDPYGNLNIGPYPSIQMFTSISNPPPPWNATPLLAGVYGGINYWDISSFTWTPNHPLRALNQYFNQTSYEVTTGWVDPKGGFTLQSTLGHLYESPQQGATVPFYSCKSGSTNYFVSLDFGCEGGRILGTNGYGYSKPMAGLKLVPLYHCSTTTGPNVVSKNSGCQGQASGQLLGYALP